jgi:hypothetical protein
MGDVEKEDSVPDLAGVSLTGQRLAHDLSPTVDHKVVPERAFELKPPEGFLKD